MYESLLREPPQRAARKSDGEVLNSNETSSRPVRRSLQDGGWSAPLP